MAFHAVAIEDRRDRRERDRFVPKSARGTARTQRRGHQQRCRDEQCSLRQGTPQRCLRADVPAQTYADTATISQTWSLLSPRTLVIVKVLGAGHERVAISMSGTQIARMMRIGLELAAQARDRHVDGACQRRMVVAPDET